MSQIELSVIIVTYNSGNYISSCLTSVFGSIDIEPQVIVIDNHSTDESVALIRRKFPKIYLIENKENMGFSVAVNIGLRLSAGNYILILNPDTILPKGRLREMLVFLDAHPNIGMVGPKLIRSDGSIDHACHRNFPTVSDIYFQLFSLNRLFPHSKLFNHYNLSIRDSGLPEEVDCISGAFMLVKKDALQQVGLMDERFFLYVEDVDWAYRFNKAGWKVYYYPYLSVVHIKRASAKKVGLRAIKEFYKATYQGYEKYYGSTTGSFVNWFTKRIIEFRMFLSILAFTIRQIFE
jgi:GT2 family glycosyltransferase